jgi:peptidoglycan hydrolase-like protein with peptidoglycan-binding domain
MKILNILIISILFLQNSAFAFGIESSSIPSHNLMQNECVSTDYSSTDFLVVKNIKTFLNNEGYYEGVNDDNFDTKLKESLKDFQKDVGIKIDGVMGPTTYRMMQYYDSCTEKSDVNLISCFDGSYKAYKKCTTPYKESPIPVTTTTIPTTTTTTTIPNEPDLIPPVWDTENPPFASEVGSLFKLNLPSVSDNVGIEYYEVYVNEVLSTHTSLSEFQLLVTPTFDMTCADQHIYAVAYDAAGNFSNSPKIIIPKSDLCTVKNPTGFLLSLGSSESDVGWSIAVDSSDNSYAVGQFRGTVNFGGGDVTSVGDYSVYVLKLSPSGQFQWVHTFATSTPWEITVDSEGNSYIAGFFSGKVNFGGGDVTSDGATNSFILKLNSLGQFQSVYTFGSTAFILGIDVSSSGNIYTTGNFSGTVNFGGGDVTSDGSGDIFVLKLDSTFQFAGVTKFGDVGNDEAYGIDIDSDGNLYVAGYYSGTVDDAHGGAITSNGGTDVVVFKLDPSLMFQWVYSFGSTGADIARGIAVDSSGSAYIAGNVAGTVDFGLGSISLDSSNGYLVKLFPDGSFNRTFLYPNTNGWGAYVDSSNNVYFTGNFYGTTNFGFGDVEANGSDAFILKLGSWVNTFSGDGASINRRIGVDSNGNPYLSGYFSGDEAVFGTNFTSKGSNDIFILKLNAKGKLE